MKGINPQVEAKLNLVRPQCKKFGVFFFATTFAFSTKAFW